MGMDNEGFINLSNLKGHQRKIKTKEFFKKIGSGAKVVGKKAVVIGRGAKVVAQGLGKASRNFSESTERELKHHDKSIGGGSAFINPFEGVTSKRGRRGKSSSFFGDF